MDLDDLIITWFCLMDDALMQILQGRRLRERGPVTTLSDSEVLTMEVVGEYLGLEQDTAIFAYFRRHWPHFFPALLQVHRTTFVRQAANLHVVKERLWHWAQDQTPHDPELAILDSLALPICQFTRAPRSRLFQGEAAFGFDHLTHHSFYGFRLHARVCWPGVIAQIELTAGNGQELDAALDLTQGTRGLALGDRNYWSPRVRAELATNDVCLVAPYRWRTRDPWPMFSRDLSRWRYRIDTIFGQLVERTAIKRVWARDYWHLANRLLRKVLMHTLAVFTNLALGRLPLHLADLVT